MEKKKVWIFGDSYATSDWNDPTCDLSYTWPRRLAEKYDVTNLAHSGTGIWWSIDQLKKLWWSIDQLKKQLKYLSFLPSKLFKSQQQKDIIVIFFASGYVFRPHFTFFDDPKDSAFMKEFIRRDKKIPEESFYKQYVDFIKNFYEYSDEHQDICDDQNINYVSYYTLLKELSNKFNKILVIPCFDIPHELFGKLENTDKFMIAEGQPLYLFDEKNVNTYCPNHMTKENHDIMFNMLVDWIENNAVFDTKKLIKIS